MRTMHLMAVSVLVGGHAYDVSPAQLLWPLWLTIASGVGLIVVEAYPSARWLFQLRGAMVLLKLAIMAIVPLFWEQRLILLLLIVAIASVGSHMPSRFRYFSLLHMEVPADQRRQNQVIRTSPLVGCANEMGAGV
jgi:hypothetical protein